MNLLLDSSEEIAPEGETKSLGSMDGDRAAAMRYTETRLDY